MCTRVHREPLFILWPPQQVARPSERFAHRILIANKSTGSLETKYLSLRRAQICIRARGPILIIWSDARCVWNQRSLDLYRFVIFNVSLNFIADYI